MTQFTKIYSFEICFNRVMVIRKIGIVNVQLVKDNFATRKHYHLKLSTRKKQLAIRTKKIIIFSTHKTQPAARTFISNSKHRFATCKITLQLVKRN